MEVRNISIPELAAAVAALPEAIREELARGPMDYGGYCRLCRALRAGGMYHEDDLDEASRTVYQWHEDHETLAARGITDTFVDGEPTAADIALVTEELRVGDAGDVARTFAGAISYYRLCLVYLLAGWRPEEAAQVDTQYATRSNPSPTGTVTPRGASGPAPSSLWQIIGPRGSYRTPGRA